MMKDKYAIQLKEIRFTQNQIAESLKKALAMLVTVQEDLADTREHLSLLKPIEELESDS